MKFHMFEKPRLDEKFHFQWQGAIGAATLVQVAQVALLIGSVFSIVVWADLVAEPLRAKVGVKLVRQNWNRTDQSDSSFCLTK